VCMLEATIPKLQCFVSVAHVLMAFWNWFWLDFEQVFASELQCTMQNVNCTLKALIPKLHRFVLHMFRQLVWNLFRFDFREVFFSNFAATQIIMLVGCWVHFFGTLIRYVLCIANSNVRNFECDFAAITHTSGFCVILVAHFQILPLGIFSHVFHRHFCEMLHEYPSTNGCCREMQYEIIKHYDSWLPKALFYLPCILDKLFKNQRNLYMPLKFG